jgi:cell division protein FtsB
MSDTDPHDEIERLEAQIEEISSKLESCRKFILVARIALVGGAMLFAAILLGIIAFDQRLLLVAIAALLGGIVLWGSNHSTADEAAAELAKAEADRAALIGRLHLQVVTERPTLH